MIQQVRNRLGYLPYTTGCRRAHLQKPLKLRDVEIPGPCRDNASFLLNTGKKWIEAFSHDRVRENSIAQCRVRKCSEIWHLYAGYYFAGFTPNDRETHAAVSIHFGQRFHESAAFKQRC